MRLNQNDHIITAVFSSIPIHSSQTMKIRKTDLSSVANW